MQWMTDGLPGAEAAAERWASPVWLLTTLFLF